MKRIWMAFFSMLIFLAGCNKGEEILGSDHLSPQVKAYLSMRGGAQTAESGTQSLALGKSFTNLFGNLGGRLDGSTEPNDGDDPWHWETCAVVTETTNEDGSYTVTYDYGDGCDEGWGDYAYQMHGKFTMTYGYTYTETEDSYSDEYYYYVSYENYGGSYSYENEEYAWSLDGESEYEGQSSYNWVTGKYSGQYTHYGDMDYSYDGQLFSYFSEGSTEYDEKRSITNTGISNYAYDDNYYNSVVLKPLVYKYACNEADNFNRYVYTYVSGSEQINYSENGETGSFIIDYGNGECDNIIFIIQDGKRIKVDLGDMWMGDVVTTNGRK